MKNETVQTPPRKLSKPVREQTEMKREELVTYANESGSFETTGFVIHVTTHRFI